MTGLPRAARGALQKARDAALLAVEVYNKPAVTFKSGGYITLMIIAWTALFHAIFFRRKVKPYYRSDRRKQKSRYLRVGWHTRCWQRYKVRPDRKSSNPEMTDSKYCIYDKAHNDYVYTEAWVQFLIEKFKDEKEYEALFAKTAERPA